MVSVADLVTNLHSNIDEIHKTIALISDTSDHDAEITRLEKERDEQLQQLKMAHEIATKEDQDARVKQEQKIEEEIKREEAEITARRRREDEERNLTIENAVNGREKARQEEEEKRKAEFESKHKGLEDGVDEEMEKLEDELEKRMSHGQKALESLDAARREINKQIDEHLNIPTVLPKIQYKSRRKALLNKHRPDRSSENPDIKEVGENSQNNLDTNEDPSPNVNEHKNEGPRDDETNVANSTEDPNLEHAKGLVMQPASPMAEEVIHQEQETQYPGTEQIEEVSRLIEKISVSMPEEQHLEPEEPQHPEQQHQLENTAQEHPDLPKQDTVQPIEDVSNETYNATEVSLADTLMETNGIPMDQIVEHQTNDAEQHEISDTSKQNNPLDASENAEDHVKESQSAEFPSENVTDGLKQDKTPIVVPKEAESSSAHATRESPEDRAAREEIDQLNEEIRQAMEEEARGAMMPHDEAKDLPLDAQEEELIKSEESKSEESHVFEVITTPDFANEASENKALAKEDTLPKMEGTPIAQISEFQIVSNDFESRTIPETIEAENASKHQVVSESIETENKGILEPEEQANGTTQEPIETPTEVTLLARELSLEQTLNIDLTPENHGLLETLTVHVSPDQTVNEKIEEMPVTLREKAILPPMSVEELTSGNVGDGNAEMEDDSLPNESLISSKSEDTNQISTEAETVHNGLESAHHDEPIPVEEFEVEAIQTPLPEPAEDESVLLNEEPALQSDTLSNEPVIDQSQQATTEPVSTEDINNENAQTSNENIESVNEATPIMKGKNRTGEEPSNLNISDEKSEEVVPDQNPAEQNEYAEKDGGDAASSEVEAEDNENPESNNLGESPKTPQAILPGVEEMKSTSDEPFLPSKSTPEVVQPDVDSHENSEGDILSSHSQNTSENNNLINEIVVPIQEELHFKDTDIDHITKVTVDSKVIHQSEPRNINLDDTPQKAEVAVEPIISGPEQIHDAEEDIPVTAESGTSDIRELEVAIDGNVNVAKDERSSDKEALDSPPEYLSQTIYEPVQLPGHIKYRIDEPAAAIRQENDALPQTIAKEEIIISETSIIDPEDIALKLTDEKIESSSDINSKEHFQNVEEVKTPGHQDLEGTGGAILTLNIGSPLPSPILHITGGNEGGDAKLEHNVIENPVGLEEMSHKEEQFEVNDSARPQELKDIEPVKSSEMPFGDHALAEAVKSEQLTPDYDESKHQEAEETHKQANDGASLENQEDQENRDLPSTSIGEIDQDANSLNDVKHKENDIQLESQNDGNPEIEVETSALEKPIIDAFQVPFAMEHALPEIHDEPRSGQDDRGGEKVNDAPPNILTHEQGKGELRAMQDAHTEKPTKTNHSQGSETTDIPHSVPSIVTSPEAIHEELSTQEKEKSSGIEEEHINTVPESDTIRQDTTSQTPQVLQEDPEDVRAREEVARLNAEFMKAIEEEQAGEELNEPVDVSKDKNNVDVIESNPVKEEQERPSSRESAEDTTAREEIALLNEQLKLLGQQHDDGNQFVEIKGEKGESHEGHENSEPQKLEPEHTQVDLQHAKSEPYQGEKRVQEQDHHEIPTSSVQHDGNLDTSDQSDQILSGENGVELTTSEPSKEIEASQHDHEIHDFQDSGSEGEETESHFESEDEWEGSVEDEEGPLPYLETIREESHDGRVSHLGEDNEDEDEDEEMLRGRSTHPHWKYEDMENDDHLKEESAFQPAETTKDDSHDLRSHEVAAAESSILPIIDNNEEHWDSADLVLETEHAEKPANKDAPLETHYDELEHPSDINLEISKPRSIKRPQTPMQLVPNTLDDEVMEPPHTINGTDESFEDNNSEAPIKSLGHSNGIDLPRVLEPSPVINELNSNTGNPEQVEQNLPGQNNNLTPEAASSRRPMSLYHRNDDLSPEHEAVFSRVSKIRNSLTPSPEPQQSSNSLLSPRSRSERFPPDEHRNYLDASINNAYNGGVYSTMPDDDQPQNDYRIQLNANNGRTRSHTVDTVPSFEHYASDDGDSGPPTPPQQPQYSDPVSQQSHIGQMLTTDFQTSGGWSIPHDDIHAESTNQDQDQDEVIKSPNLREVEFDPLNQQEYKSPIPSPAHSSSFNVSNVRFDQEYPHTLSSNSSSLLPPEKILGSNAPPSNFSFASRNPPASAQAEETPTSQLQPNLHSVPQTQSEDLHKAANQEKEIESPQRNPRPASSIFARTRSLFESAGTNDPSPLSKQRPLSGMSIFHVTPPSRSTPSPIAIQNRPHSQSVSGLRSVSGSQKSNLYPLDNGNTNADYDPNTDADFLPKSLDDDGRLPSPAYGLPGHRSSGSFDKARDLHGDEDDPYHSQKGSKASGDWMAGLPSMTSRGAMAEDEPLLRDED
ncbi:hypothetical protein SBOR_6770 [Sclerotinia borealis F-4128]|uniref:Uncharacterized protein n=1 Tax=Sclerotinia borealis (strain F-4128) TaxID=1432307 RepID=W9C803_SCLBF|nr:hypothetical protein SBOR_6770 [Sclerotinia borealis F-4128]